MAGVPGVRTGWSHHRFFVQMPARRGNADLQYHFRTTANGHGRYLAILISLVSLVPCWSRLCVIRRLLSALERPFGRGGTHPRRRIGTPGGGMRAGTSSATWRRSFNAMSTGLREMLRSREQLLLDVSHELRSPLTRIKVALEMAPEGAAKDSIGDDLGEMEAMIAEILETARLDSANGQLNLEAVDLRALAAEAVRMRTCAPPGPAWFPGGRGRAPDRPRRSQARAQGAGQRAGQCGQVFPLRAAPVEVASNPGRGGDVARTGPGRRHSRGGTAPAVRALLPRGSLPLPGNRRLWPGPQPLQAHHGSPWRRHRHREPRGRRHRGLPGFFPPTAFSPYSPDKQPHNPKLHPVRRP